MTITLSRPETIDELIKLEIEWMDAWKRQDREAVEKILSEDFTLTSSTTDDLIYRESWLESLPRVLKKDFDFSDFHVQVYDNAAVVRSKFRQIATLDGSDFGGEFIFTDVWIKEDGKWLAVSRHSSRATGLSSSGKMGKAATA